MKDKIPLFVDLDGTLIKEDLSELAFKSILKKNPFKTIIYSFMFLFYGKAYLKEKISRNFRVPLNKIKYNKTCIKYILKAKNNERFVFLISGSHQTLVDQIQNHLKIFVAAYGTFKNYNMVGTHKTKFINDKLNYKYFDYIGNSKKDLPIWSYTENIIFTNVSKNLKRKIKNKKIKKFEIKAEFK